VRSEAGSLNLSNLARICETVRDLRAEGHRVVLVSSGAVAVGAQRLGLAARPADLAQRQALAAVGQVRRATAVARGGRVVEVHQPGGSATCGAGRRQCSRLSARAPVPCGAAGRPCRAPCAWGCRGRCVHAVSHSRTQGYSQATGLFMDLSQGCKLGACVFVVGSTCCSCTQTVHSRPALPAWPRP
jgi:hypothetical protein